MMTNEIKPAKERILDAANRLFYSEGIRATSVDAIAKKADVTKKTLYYHFRSKDDLIEAYLVKRDQPNILLYKKWFEETEGEISDKVAALFMNLAKSSRHPKWKGCGFLRTAAELANMPGHPAMKVGAAHKKRLESWLCDKFEEGSLEDPGQLARHIVILMDGVFSTILIHRDAAYAEAAAVAARQLVSGNRRLSV